MAKLHLVHLKVACLFWFDINTNPQRSTATRTLQTTYSQQKTTTNRPQTDRPVAADRLFISLSANTTITAKLTNHFQWARLNTVAWSRRRTRRTRTRTRMRRRRRRRRRRRTRRRTRRRRTRRRRRRMTRRRRRRMTRRRRRTRTRTTTTTSPLIVEMSVTNNSSLQNYPHMNSIMFTHLAVECIDCNFLS